MPNYSPILDSEIDAESPITESLMTRLRDNPLALEGEDYTELTGSGTYTVPSDVNLLKVILIGGGSGGRGGDVAGNGGGGGSSGCVYTGYVSTSGGASISYACGAGGAGGSASNVNGADGGNTTFGSLTALGGKGASHTTGAPARDVGRTFYLMGGEGSANLTTNGTDGEVFPSAMHGTAGTVAAANGGGGGGAPCGVPMLLNTTSLGNGGAGYENDTPTSAANATTYGAGGGGGHGTNSGNGLGGNGSAGIVFVLPLNS